MTKWSRALTVSMLHVIDQQSERNATMAQTNAATQTEPAANAPAGLATGQAADKPKRKPPVRNLGPRPAYVLVNAPEDVDIKSIEIVGVTRKAEEALEAIDSGRARQYVRLMIK